MFILILGGCADRSAPSVLLALDGPPLFVAAKSETRAMSGVMDRSCMAGVGGLILHDRPSGVSCQGNMDHPADNKGRMHTDLACSDGTAFTLVMRNLGPDQGMGVGKFAEGGEIITLFYHPCEGEAARRLEALMRDIGAALEKKKRRELEAAP